MGSGKDKGDQGETEKLVREFLAAHPNKKAELRELIRLVTKLLANHVEK